MTASSPNPYASLKTPFSACDICMMRREQAKHQAAAGITTKAPSVGHQPDDQPPTAYHPTLSRALSSASTSSSTSSHGAWSPSLDGPCQCGSAEHDGEAARKQALSDALDWLAVHPVTRKV